MRWYFTALLFLGLTGLVPLMAQENSPPDSEEQGRSVDALINSALEAADRGAWDEALAILDEAAAMAPADPRIASYRKSIQELRKLDVPEEYVESGKPEGGGTQEKTPEPEDEEPKFVIDRGEDFERGDVSRFRDNLRLDIGFKLFALDPTTNTIVTTWSSAKEFFYSSFSVDLRYWFPFWRRSLGLHFGSNGYSWRPGNPTLLFNSLDLGVNLRGFLLEEEDFRLELGLDFGVSMHSSEYDAGVVDRKPALFIGFWGLDPILYHIFRVSSLGRILIGGGIRIYSTFGDVLLETIHYRIDAVVRFNWVHFSLRAEWWEFSETETKRSIFSLSLSAGFHY